MKLGNKKAAEEDIKHIPYYQHNVFSVINEFVYNFDIEWFKILVDSCPYLAMGDLSDPKDAKKWQALCQQQFETEDYTRWYNNSKDWYNKHCNTCCNHKKITSYFEKTFYIHKSKPDV